MVHLAKALVRLKGARYVRPSVAANIVSLWQKLSEADRAPVSFPRRYQSTLNRGMFKASKTGRKSSVPGVDSARR